jgi:hypothetical protein
VLLSRRWSEVIWAVCVAEEELSVTHLRQINQQQAPARRPLCPFTRCGNVRFADAGCRAPLRRPTPPQISASSQPVRSINPRRQRAQHRQPRISLVHAHCFCVSRIPQKSLLLHDSNSTMAAHDHSRCHHHADALNSVRVSCWLMVEGSCPEQARASCPRINTVENIQAQSTKKMYSNPARRSFDSRRVNVDKHSFRVSSRLPSSPFIFERGQRF